MAPKKAIGEVPAAVEKENVWDRHIESILLQLSQMYINRVEPVEAAYLYNVFRPSWFAESIKQRRPFITFLGPFSSGKSSFINYLLQGDYLLTGPQPVTDKFTVVMYGEKVQHIPGHVLLADARQPFRGLSQFGDAFAESFAGVVAPHPILRSVSFVDTPGILEAAGNVHARRYNYAEVCRWFVEKSDLVFFLFDPTKLDAGPELRQVFSHSLKNQESKIRIVMNKADTIRPQELMRVYGSLFWNLSNLIQSTEPPRLYISSFWDKPYREETDHALFETEKEDLLYELIVTIPLQSLDRRVTTMMRRVNAVLIFALICATYRTRRPAVFGKSKAKERFFEEYTDICKTLADRYHVSENNFPTSQEVRAFLEKVDSKDFPDMEKLEKKGWAQLLRTTQDRDLPGLLQPIKDHSIGDPQDRRGAIMLQRQYINRQVSFPPTVQTSLDNTPGSWNTAAAVGPGSPILTSAALPTAAAAAVVSTSTLSPLPPPAATVDSQTQMMLMMQQMMSMQQQQMRTSVPGSATSVHLASPPPPAAAANGGANNAQMQAMMHNMMMLMQQQQQPEPQLYQ